MRRKNLKIVTPRISPPTTLTLKRLLSNERGFGAGPPFISAYSEVRRLIFFREFTLLTTKQLGRTVFDL